MPKPSSPSCSPDLQEIDRSWGANGHAVSGPSGVHPTTLIPCLIGRAAEEPEAEADPEATDPETEAEEKEK